MTEPAAEINGHQLDYHDPGDTASWGQWACRRCGAVGDYANAFLAFPCKPPAEAPPGTSDGDAQ